MRAPSLGLGFRVRDMVRVSVMDRVGVIGLAMVLGLAHFTLCPHYSREARIPAGILPFPSCNKKHLKNVGPICHCEPPHAHSPGVATVATVARRLRIDVHDNADANDDNDNDNA